MNNVEPEICYLKIVGRNGSSSLQGPFPYEQLQQAYRDGELGDDCEFINAVGLSLSNATTATGWRSITQVAMSESTERLLKRLVAIQKRQLYWIRMIAIVVWGSCMLVLIFGMTFRFWVKLN